MFRIMQIFLSLNPIIIITENTVKRSRTHIAAVLFEKILIQSTASIRENTMIFLVWVFKVLL